MTDDKSKKETEMEIVEIEKAGAIGGKIGSERYRVPELADSNLLKIEKAKVLARATNKTAVAAMVRFETAREEMALTKRRAEEAARIVAVETILVSENDWIKDNQEVTNRGLGGGYREETRSEIDMDAPSGSKGAISKEQRERS